jgi:uncharacterized protein (UPF0254 family)
LEKTRWQSNGRGGIKVVDSNEGLDMVVEVKAALAHECPEVKSLQRAWREVPVFYLGVLFGFCIYE